MQMGIRSDLLGLLAEGMQDRQEGNSMTLNDREKAAFIVGMVRAFNSGKWPKHFNKDDKAQWMGRAVWAHQILTGGAYNPFHVWKVREIVDDELAGEI